MSTHISSWLIDVARVDANRPTRLHLRLTQMELEVNRLRCGQIKDQPKDKHDCSREKEDECADGGRSGGEWYRNDLSKCRNDAAERLSTHHSADIFTGEHAWHAEQSTRHDGREDVDDEDGGESELEEKVLIVVSVDLDEGCRDDEEDENDDHWADHAEL